MKFQITFYAKSTFVVNVDNAEDSSDAYDKAVAAVADAERLELNMNCTLWMSGVDEKSVTFVHSECLDDDGPELTHCLFCDAWINPQFGADSPAEHAGAAGTEDDPRSPGDYDDICDVCNYDKGLRGGPNFTPGIRVERE